MSFRTSLTNKAYYLASVYAAIYCLALVCFFGFAYQPWTDEEHFYFTILEFIQQPTFNTLRHYEEMSTPLPFILYAIWGWLFNTELTILRVFSLIITFVAIVSAFHLFKKSGLSTIASFISILVLTINPYFAGVSFFVYTDMLCVLFMIWAFLFLALRNIAASCICLLLAILCRQYMVFFIPATAVYLFAQEGFGINLRLIKKELLLLIPVLGFGGLLLFWGGASPDNKLKELYMHHAFSFHANALTAYMASSMLYTFPLLLLAMKDLTKKQFYIALPISIVWYLLFPVQGSQVAVESMLHIDTIGLIHRATHHLPPLAEQALWLLLFVLSSLVFTIAFEKAIKNHRSVLFLVCCSWFFFLLTMSLSYLTWEKYLLPILPALLVYGGMLFDEKLLKQFDRIRK